MSATGRPLTYRAVYSRFNRRVNPSGSSPQIRDLKTLQRTYETYQALGLSLNMQRGQPSDADLDLSNGLLSVVGPKDTVSPSGVELRNYGGGVAGLPEARALFAELLNTVPEGVIVGNNSSLELQSLTLMWALLRGLNGSPGPWRGSPKIIVSVPGYDRHFSLLQALGFALLSVKMTPEGPDVKAVQTLVQNESVKGLLFVPTYSNPTGDTTTQAVAQELATLKTAAPDFTIFADDAYRVHHLTPNHDTPPDLLAACAAAGHPHRAYVFGSTSKITFAGAGLGFMASSPANITYLSKLLGQQTIGPNKLEQYRHVKFLRDYPGGLRALMMAHARLIAPKFEAVDRVLTRELGASGLASWTKPKGGYFISLHTRAPVAARVVELAKGAGVALTPAGATYPDDDPTGSNIRLAPTRPSLAEIEQATEVIALCIELASAEHEARSD